MATDIITQYIITPIAKAIEFVFYVYIETAKVFILCLIAGAVGVVIELGQNLTIFSHGGFRTELFEYSGTLPTKAAFFAAANFCEILAALVSIYIAFEGFVNFYFQYSNPSPTPTPNQASPELLIALMVVYGLSFQFNFLRICEALINGYLYRYNPFGSDEMEVTYDNI